MIDFLELRIPFAERVLVSTTCIDLCKYARTADSIRISTNDLLVGNDISSFMPMDLVHPWESIKSHFSGLAFKVYPNGMGEYKTPFVSLKGSPAKIMQGHNVFGSENFNRQCFEFFNILQAVYPTIFNDLDIEATEIRAIDLTYSARLKNEYEAQQVIDVLKHISANKLKDQKMNYGSSVYFNERSTYCINKTYLKHVELTLRIKEMKKKIKRKTTLENEAFIKRQININESVLKHAEGLVRFESRYLARKLDKIGFPINIIDFKSHCLDEYGSFENAFRKLWHAQWDPIFQKFEGLNVNVNSNKQIIDLIQDKYVTFKDFHTYSIEVKNQQIKYRLELETSTDLKRQLALTKLIKSLDKDLIIKTVSRPQNRTANKLIRFFRLLKSEGFLAVKLSEERTTFYRCIKQLVEAGIPEYQLQNLTKDSQNVIPLIRLINVDFSAQRPEDYIEPKSQFLN
jgi:II/X family phage/plasmid replication protein